MVATEITAALSGVDLFAGLPPKVVAQIAERGHEAHYDAGVPVVVQGESVTGFKAFSPTGVEMHVILEGRARVDVNGVTHTVLGPGQYFGEVALIDGQPRSADVVPEEGGLRTFAISKWTFEDVLEKHPEIAVPMLRVMASRLRTQEAGSR
jgi:CRP/FNR family cyclic AMP-dependent transcriptional regulator